jgi:glycosidase
MIQADFCAENLESSGHAVFLALGSPSSPGSAVVPFGCGEEGSTVFLPFNATQLHRVQLTPDGVKISVRLWNETQWAPACLGHIEVEVTQGRVRLKVPREYIGTWQRLNIAVYAKDLRENSGWGRLFQNRKQGIPGGYGDQSIAGFREVDLESGTECWRGRFLVRPRIYQLLPRLFGNTNETRKPNGTFAENGSGKFADINEAALKSLKTMGFSHLWLTGVLRQATGTPHPAAGLSAEDPDILKGIAGSPYAIRDYFDVCPDYATDPRNRLEEFKALLGRLRHHGLKAIIDFVPNHVSRAYSSSRRLDLGTNDRTELFFHAQNHFFHLPGQRLELPTWKEGTALSATCRILGGCDGQFAPEQASARVSGNNVAHSCPGIHDWYETVKLNYGYDFTTGYRAYPHGGQPGEIPDTWREMDAILAYWQEAGIDGFRCDMSHMVPPEFWAWTIPRARARNPEVLFFGEAYEDHMKVPSGDPLLNALNERRGHVLLDLLSAGFDAVYDDPSYKKLKQIYDGPGWANDLGDALWHPFLFDRSLRYAENHDEVRLAARGEWGAIGMHVGRPVSAVLYGLSRGPVLLYHGQEIGEPAVGPSGFCTDNARTTIFDYWSMPEFAKWVNDHQYDGGRLSLEQKTLRDFYSRLVQLCAEPAFAHGEFYALNPCNLSNPRFGRLEAETASGHWLYAFLRHDPRSGQSFLVTANFHRSAALENVHLELPTAALDFLELQPETPLQGSERLWNPDATPIRTDRAGEGLTMRSLPPLSAMYWLLS